MPSLKNGPLGGEAPRWIVIASVLVIVGGVIYFGRNAVTGHEAAPRPPKKVYPGMYDLRAEAQKFQAKAGQQQPANGNP